MIEASGLEARVIQHEMDHLDGVLILDRATREQRKEALRVLRGGEEHVHDASRAPATPPASCRSVRTVYLGSSRFAVDVLGALAASPHAPALVVTPPDRPQGRGRKTAPPPAAVAARDLGLPLLQAESVNDPEAVAAIDEAAPEAIGVCEFGQLIREPLLSRYLMLNVHPSLLPRWRGAAPIERALMAGDTVTGVTIFQLEEGLDSGPDGAQPRGADPARTTRAARSAERLAALGGDAADRGASTRPRRARSSCTEQPEEGVTYAEKIDPAERRLDPARPGRRAGARRARAHARHRRVPRARGRRAPGGRGGARRGRGASSPARSSRTTAGCSSAAPRARSSCSRAARRAGGRCRRRLPARPPPARGSPAESVPHRRAPLRLRGRAPRVRAGRLRRPRVPRRGGAAASSTAATARSRCGSPTAWCSGARRSTT